MAYYTFTEAFRRHKISLGGRGTVWCGLNPDGVLVLMAHRNYLGSRYLDPKDPRTKIRTYLDPGYGRPGNAPSVTESLEILGNYFSSGKREIILLEAEFKFDSPAQFKRATGRAFQAILQDFNPATGRILCQLHETFSY
jgi:hypothetical protein